MNPGNDINPFVAIITSGQTVPEPTWLTLLVLAGVAIIRRKK